MIAVLLAAGMGRRLQDAAGKRPKVLLEVGGRTLLERHLDALDAAGVRKVVIVAGYLHQELRAALAGRTGSPHVEIVVNRGYTLGSLISLHCAREALGAADGALVMDADVLYPRALLLRLVETPGSAFLLDERARETGEEMMLGVRGDRVRAIGRRIGEDWQRKGEGVGFFKVAAEHVEPLVAELASAVLAGELFAEYETVLDRLVQRCPAVAVPVGDLPWTEIDFPEDAQRAASLAREIDVLDRGPRGLALTPPPA